MRIYIAIKSIVAGMLIVSLAACTTLNTKVGGLMNLDTDLNLTFEAEADINPDDNKRPAPLFVRMYELKSDKQFNMANFIDLYERDKEVLGADMIAKQRLKRIAPGETRKEEYVLDTQTRFVGLFAEFSQYKDASFKVIIPVAPTNVVASSVVVTISGNRVNVAQ
jgi:type VI secretion system protein VasD